MSAGLYTGGTRGRSRRGLGKWVIEKPEPSKVKSTTPNAEERPGNAEVRRLTSALVLRKLSSWRCSGNPFLLQRQHNLVSVQGVLKLMGSFLVFA